MSFFEIPQSLWNFYFWLAVASFIAALLSAVLLKTKYADRYSSLFLLFFILNMSIPGLGFVVNLWLVYYLLTVKVDKKIGHISSLNIDMLTERYPKIKRIFGEASIHSILSGSQSVSRDMRLKALVALADQISREELRLIQRALSDKDDEIRLYSFALINKIEESINKQIDEKLKQYKKYQEDDKKAEIAKELSMLYWDMVYYEIVDNALKQFFLKESYRYGNEAIKSFPDDIKLKTILSKCLLMLGDIDRAYRCLKEVYLESQDEYILPYLAEIKFNQGKFAAVKEMLQNKNALRNNQLLNPIVEIWSGSDAQ